MKPLISVCIPTYNGESYLSECLDSVLAQTFSDFELLIVDDQSSDQTLDIVKKYAEKDLRIRIIQNRSNLGLVGNWNNCIDLAKGEFIKFVFQDDLIVPECLEKMLLATKPSTSIVFCRRNFIFEDVISEELHQFYLSLLFPEKFLPNSTEISEKDFCQAALKNIGLNFIGEPTVVMIRKDVFQKFGNFNPNLIQLCDLEFWSRVASNTGITYVPETLATFRIHGKSTSSTNADKNQYRRDLDVLIMLHDFAHHQVYENFRQLATNFDDPINLREVFNRSAYYEWKKANLLVKESNKMSCAALDVWKNVAQIYPAFKPNFLTRLRVYSDRLHQKIIKLGRLPKLIFATLLAKQ
jgi:glycosyltransferase involved in cell wall biosynthesis